FLWQDADFVHGGPFEGNSQVIEFFHLLKIKRLHLPATAEHHFNVAFPLQPIQGFSHGRAAGVQAGTHVALAELVPRDQPKLKNIVLQGFVNPVCHGGFSFGGRFHFWSLPSIWGCPLFWVFGAGPAVGVSLSKDAVNPSMGADRKSTRLNSSHVKISYAVFCLK